MARKPADQSVNREDILLAAADVLSTNGYDSTTMKDIAAKVNLTAASLYHHFKNKDTLLLAVLESGLEQVYDLIEPIYDSDMPYTEKLEKMIKAHVNSVTRMPSVGAAMVFEIRSLMSFKAQARNGLPDEAQAEFIQRRDHFFELRDKFEMLFRYTVRAGIQAGEFRECDPAIFAKMMLGAHNWIGVWYKDGGRLTGNVVADMMAENFLASLRKEP